MLDTDSSTRLNLLRFPLIVGVVFIHSASTNISLADADIAVPTSSLNEFIINLVSHGVARVAVPLFFLLSGYFFFLGFRWSWADYGVKLRTRVHTLLIPHVFWNSLTLFVFAVAQGLPATRIFVSGRLPSIADFSLFDYVNSIIGITIPPIAYQFWFIRDLMVNVLLVPIMCLMFTRAPAFLLGVLFICWFTGIWPVAIPVAVSVLFFCLGGYLSWTGKSLFSVDRVGVLIATLYPPVIIADALLKNHALCPYLHKCGILLGMGAALYATKYLARSESLKSWLLWLCGASFFVFAAHQPLMTVVRKGIYVGLSPTSPAISLSLYFLIPIAIIVLLVVVHRILQSAAPTFVRIITGGR